MLINICVKTLLLVLLSTGSQEHGPASFEHDSNWPKIISSTPPFMSQPPRHESTHLNQSITQPQHQLYHHQPQSTRTHFVPPSVHKQAVQQQLKRKHRKNQRRRRKPTRPPPPPTRTNATLIMLTKMPSESAKYPDTMQERPMLERRSIPQFGNMITLYTKMTPFKFVYYGNWCGSGGMGPPLDDIDRCCQVHDQCYGRVIRRYCPYIWQQPYSLLYAWKWKHGKTVCLRTTDRCIDHTCNCDKAAAECFGHFMVSKKLIGNRLRKNKKRFG